MRKLLGATVLLFPLWSMADCDNVPLVDNSTFNQKQSIPDQNHIDRQISSISAVLSIEYCLQIQEQYNKTSENTKLLNSLLTIEKEKAGTNTANLDELIEANNETLKNLIISPWQHQAKTHCKKHGDISFTDEMTVNEIKSALIKNKLEKAKSLKNCLNHLTDGLEKSIQFTETLIPSIQDKTKKQKTEDSIKFQRKDLATLKNYKTANDQLLADAEIDNKANKHNATLDDIGTYYEKEQAYANVFTNDVWYPAFFIGAKFSPEYDSNGKNQGFNDTSYFGRFTIDARWVYNKFIMYPGVSLDFNSAKIVNCDTKAEGQEKEECDNKTSINNLKFNDISDVVDASFHTWLHPYQSDSKQLEIGPGFRVGMQSRDELSENGDSVNAYHTVGIRFIYNDFMKPVYKDKNYANGMPRFILEASYAEYDDFAGTGQKGYRKIVMGQYRIIEDSPVNLGFVINSGSGPDEMALTVSYGLKAERLLQMIGL